MSRAARLTSQTLPVCAGPVNCPPREHRCRREPVKRGSPGQAVVAGRPGLTSLSSNAWRQPPSARTFGPRVAAGAAGTHAAAGDRRASMAPKPACPANTAASAVAAVASGAAVAAVAAGTDQVADNQAGVTAAAAGTASAPDTSDTPRSAVSSVSALQQSAATAIAPGRTWRAQTTTAAGTEQTGVTAVAATGMSAAAGSAAAAVAEQQPAGRAVLPGPGCPMGTITDQRASQEQLCGRIDHTQYLLLEDLQG